MITGRNSGLVMRYFWGNLTIIIVLILSQSTFVGLPKPVLIEDTKLSKPKYFSLVTETFQMTSEELSLFEKNGFIVLNRMGTDDILDAYKYYWKEDLPIFITTDTMLQVWHLLFDNSLEYMEEIILFPLLRDSCKKMFEKITREWVAGESYLTIEDTMIYLAVGAKLVDSNINIPQELQEATNQIVTAINNEITIFDAVNQFQSDITRRYIDDFSQYKPRGHYTHSETLQIYFKLFKWFSRIPFFFDSYAGQYYLSRSPLQMIESASILVWIMKNTQVTQQAKGLDIWQYFAKFLNVVFGKTYSISPTNIDKACSNLIGDNWHPSMLSENDLTSIQQSILSNNSLPTPKSAFIIDVLAQSNISPKTFVLFGERLTLDTYAFNHLVYPYVPERLFPNGLDMAATCLQSSRAQNLLSENYQTINNYQSMTEQMQDEIQSWSPEEKLTVYWTWVETLKHLTPMMPLFNDSNIPNVPSFMQMGSWRDEKLTTILSSWAQLKHDAILYIQQSYTRPLCSTPEGYVEPYPRFYSELGQLCKLYQQSITQFSSLGINLSNFNWYNAFQPFIDSTFQLETIAQHELAGTPLSTADKTFIQNIYCEKSEMCGIIEVNGWLPDILKHINLMFIDPFGSPNSRASLVADVHTDLNTKKVLEVATGLLEPLIVTVPGWEGEDIVAVGPVFSYYEFIMPMEKRMTDEDWRGIIQYSLEYQLDPSYNFSNSPRGFWAQTYMVSTEMTTSRLYNDMIKYEAPEWFRSGRFASAGNPYEGFELAPYDIFNSTSYLEVLNSSGYVTQESGITNQDSNFANIMIISFTCCITAFIRKISRQKKRKS